MAMFEPQVYVITLQGELEPYWSDRLGGMTITIHHTPDGPVTILAGELVDQAALQGILKAVYVRQRLVSIGDDFWIENDRGERAFKVDGKALRMRQTLIFEDAHGDELCKIQERMMRITDSMEIEGPDGERLATVKKALITPMRDR